MQQLSLVPEDNFVQKQVSLCSTMSKLNSSMDCIALAILAKNVALLIYTTVNLRLPKGDKMQETKTFHYCTCPAGRVTYNFTRPAITCTCPLKVYAIKNIRE